VGIKALSLYQPQYATSYDSCCGADCRSNSLLTTPDPVAADFGGCDSVALTVGVVAALFHRSLGVRYWTTAVVIAGAAASHGLLDMMTDSGMPVAYLWPLSSTRMFADWRPLHAIPLHRHHFLALSVIRLGSELRQLIVPMTVGAVGIRFARTAITKASVR
jgi:membrane-bound metal-dependent hydrolase YbcI (DUF457 family)